MRKLLAIVLLLIAAPAFASEADTAALHKAEQYLNGITSLQARFTQVDHDGKTHEGDLYI